MMDTSTYIKILTDTLMKKSKVLDELIELNKEEVDSLTIDEVNMEQFDEILNKKEYLIQQLNQLDDGFEKVYTRVSEQLVKNSVDYKDNIIIIQELIKNIMDKSINLQIKEKYSKGKFESYILNRKQEIKKYNTSNQTVSNYYKNMMNEYQGESFFLDKKN